MKKKNRKKEELDVFNLKLNPQAMIVFS